MSSPIKNSNIVDHDISSGQVSQSKRDNGHIFSSKTPFDVAQKYFIKAQEQKVGESIYLRYSACKLNSDAKLIDIPSLSVFIEDIVIKGPFVPHKDTKVAGGKTFDAGPKKPGLSFSVSEGNILSILDYLDLSAKCAYIFNKSKFGKAYKNAVTFVPSNFHGRVQNNKKKMVEINRTEVNVLTEDGYIVPIDRFENSNEADEKIEYSVDAYMETFTNESDLLYVLQTGFESKIKNGESSKKLYLSSDFYLPRGAKTKKIGGDNITSDEELEKMKRYDTWNFRINLAIRKNDKIQTIMGPGNEPMNWFQYGTEEGRKLNIWTNLVKNFPEMDRLPLPNLISSPDKNFLFKGGLRISIASVGDGSGYGKSHYNIEECYVLPERIGKGTSNAEGDTIQFMESEKDQFSTVDTVESGAIDKMADEDDG